MRKTLVRDFNFAINCDEKKVIINGVDGKKVEIPHTWNVDADLEEYVDTAWYSTEIFIDKISFKMVLFFHAIYRDCVIYLNGFEVAKHFNSGYTPFEVDITKHINMGKNLLVIKCCNSYSGDALPYKKDFDWANDGGIIRPIELLEFDCNSVEHFKIVSQVTAFLSDNICNALLSCRFDFCAKNYLAYSIKIREKKSGKEIFNKNNITNDNIEFGLKNIFLWDTENPFLYTLEIECGENIQTKNFGVRKIEVCGDCILLNNKPIRLYGVEWMPGSNPEYGMAEPESELRKNLQMLKDLNCNFTRFHWQQDDFVYDWCDENGLMVQEEIPYWGAPKIAGEQQLKVAKQQADEMVLYHFNHPSIICWGVGNELDGCKIGTINYVKKMVAYFKNIDTMRLVNYVSNTFAFYKFKRFITKINDATYYGDICMWNEYLGTWVPNPKYDSVYKYVVSQKKNKPLIVTEFGLCEPFFKGGDERRIEIYKQKLDYYKKYSLNGWVYFSLNDYRTHVGEMGKGKLKQRIHGSTDLYGNKKPSYNFIKSKNSKEKV